MTSSLCPYKAKNCIVIETHANKKLQKNQIKKKIETAQLVKQIGLNSVSLYANYLKEHLLTNHDN